MKFSTAIVALTVGVAGASPGILRSGRRAKNKDGAAAAAPAGKVPVSNQARRRAGEPVQGGELKCEEEKIEGIVHLSFTGPDDNFEANNGHLVAAPALMFGQVFGGTGFGGFAFEYDSETQKVEFKGAAGSNFDFDVCMEYPKKKNDVGCQYNPGRRMQEDGIAEDGGNYCDGHDTILYCPMKPGQCASFELTDTIETCRFVPDSGSGGSGYEDDATNDDGTDDYTEDDDGAGDDFMIDDVGMGDDYSYTPFICNDIELHLITPDGLTPDGRKLRTDERKLGDDYVLGYDYGDEDAVAALQCASNSRYDFLQTSERLHGNNDEPLGQTYCLRLEGCIIDADYPP